MSRPKRFSSNTIRTFGALLPSDVLARAAAGEGLEGLEPADYGLGPDVRFRDAVTDAWNEARRLWWSFRKTLRELPEYDVTATSPTREHWLLPLLNLLGFDDIEPSGPTATVGDTEYPISHWWRGTPLHLMGSKVPLDKRSPGIPGAARLSPHSLLQQFLNRSEDHLWGIVSNGYRLRILRDSVSLTRQAYVEFDLEAMFNGEVFPDFVVLYRVAHATRFAADTPADCLLERWIESAREEGIRALDQLRDGVETAISTLGTGFLRHPANQHLRDLVDAGDLPPAEMYRYLLRLIYRLLFLFVAEDRDLLLLPGASPEIRDRYNRYYSTARLRELAEVPTSRGQVDQWRGLVAVMGALGRDEGEPGLGLPGLGSFLWAPDSIGPLTTAQIDNEDLKEALRNLAFVEDQGSLRRIDFARLGAEEFGSVYESLLELHPAVTEGREFLLGSGAGSERKTTGSYYTPSDLISRLLDSALEPVLERAARADNPEQAILDLNVVDPAAGSGHFLVAAAHRMARRLAAVRSGEPEAPPDKYHRALRDVVSRCLFAVDVNDLAVELCKVSLWLEALQPGKPLSFLDHHIQVGNSLLGATPHAIAAGIPDAAFAVLTGDDKDVAAARKKHNKQERKGQSNLALDIVESERLGSEMETLEEFEDTDLSTVHAKEQILADWKASEGYARAHLTADAWCTAFTIPKTSDTPALTDATFRRLRDAGQIDDALAGHIRSAAGEYRFFHWHLAFPQVFRPGDPETSPGWTGGFDVVLGNPPWDKVEFSEREYFAGAAPDLAEMSGATRKKAISELQISNPNLWHTYRRQLRKVDVTRRFLSKSGNFPLAGRGKINTYAVFAELGTRVAASDGRVGVVVPTGLATDYFTKDFFADLVERHSLVSLYDFENRKKIFPAVDSRQKFCLLTLTGPASPSKEAEFSFFAHATTDLNDPERRFTLTPEDFALLNPNTRTCPIFRTRRDAEITKGIYRRVPVLVDENKKDGNPWGVEFQQGLFNMTSDSYLFRTRDQLEADGWTLEGNIFVRGDERYLPLYEGKMIHHYDHRFATYEPDGTIRYVTEEEHQDPNFVVMPRYWVPEAEVEERAPKEINQVLGFRDVAPSTNERTIVVSAIPRPVSGNNLPLLNSSNDLLYSLQVILSSFILDYCSRQKVGGSHVNFFLIKQLPLPSPPTFHQSLVDLGIPMDRLASVLSKLIVTSIDIANRVNGLPEAEVYHWVSERRARRRAWLDALMFHVYDISRDDVDYVMDTFPIVKQHDLRVDGEYTTKRMVLEAFDEIKGR